MTWGMVAVAGATLVGGYMSSQAQKDAAKSAANAQTSMANAGVAEQQRQFDMIQELLKPYASAGVLSLNKQQNLLGLNGNDAQKSAIDSIRNSSQFNEFAKQGENAILQNASATGGLRGGNVQAALAQFRPNLLNQIIQQQYSNLGGITSLGQNAAAMTGNAGMQMANSVSDLYGQAGAAQAGSALAAGKANSQFIGNMTNLVGMYALQGSQPQTGGTAAAGSGGGGGLLGGLLGGGGGGGLGGLFSDRRLKQNIVSVGTDEKTGLTLYEFNYIGNTQRMRGVMSDEVREKYPQAVYQTEEGFDTVDYDALGLKMQTV